MANFHITSTIRVGKREYVLQTVNNPAEHKVVCSFYKDGNILNTKEMDYNSQVFGEDVLYLVKRFHEEKKSDIEFLITLSKKFANSKNAVIRDMIGRAFYNHDMYEEALREIRQAIKLNPNISSPFNNLGLTYLKLKQYKEAIDAFKKAILIDSNYADYYNNLGEAYLGTKQCKNAVTAFSRALRINPYYSEAYFNLGRAYILNYLEKEDYSLSIDFVQKTEEAFERAVRINPDYLNDHFENGKKLLSLQKYSEAFQEFSKAQKKLEKSPLPEIQLDFNLKLLFKKEKVDITAVWKHIKTLEMLLKKYPTHADLYESLGTAYMVLHTFMNNKAIACFESALNVNPQLVSAKRSLKLARYERTGFQLLINAILNIDVHEQNNGRLPKRSGAASD